MRRRLPEVPHEFRLLQNFPNPFNPETVIRFSVGARSKATLTLFSLLGQEVTRLYDGDVEPGRWYEVRLQAGSFTSGVYFYRLKAGDFMQTCKLIALQ